MEKLRTVEAAQDGLRSLAKSLTLALELEENLEAMLLLGELLAGGVPFALGDLTGGLRFVMGLLGLDEFQLRGVDRLAGRGKGRLGLGGAGRGRGDSEFRHGGLLAELENAGALGVAARAGGGKLTADIGEAVFQLMESAGESLGLLLGDNALALRLGDPYGGRGEGFLLGAQHLEQRVELGIGLLNLGLLLADAEVHGVDVGTGTIHHRAELARALGVGLNAVLAREDAVAKGLEVVAGTLRLGIEGGQLLAGTGDLDFLLLDLALVEGACVGALVDLLRHLGDGALEVEVGAVGEMRVENAQVLHEGLVAAGLAGLALE